MGCLKIRYQQNRESHLKVAYSVFGEHQKVGGNYYPFGLTMAGISSKAAGGLENKRKYNGIEYENSFDLNIGEAFFRTHDPQLGRWWQIDPKLEATLSLSPYVAMNNNPISLTDPLGDIVDYERGEGVSKKEFRQMKREIRQMRRNSETFNKMFKEFKNNKDVTYTYVASSSNKGAVTEPVKGGYKMTIGINSDESKSGGSRDATSTKIGMIAHETGHAWRKTHNLDPAFPNQPKLTAPMTNAQQAANNIAISDYNVAFAYAKNTSEIGASHIENTVISELNTSGNSNFGTLELRSTYYGGIELKPRFDKYALRTLYDKFEAAINVMVPLPQPPQ
jgi:RHS repeat-associated protein